MEIAREHKVELLRTPPLTRAVYHNTKVGEEIPDGLYMAVAQVLAYIFQLRACDQTHYPRFPDSQGHAAGRVIVCRGGFRCCL